MRIGIDIDGVITDISRYYLDYGAKIIFENGSGKILDANGSEVTDILDLGNMSIDELWQKYDKFYTKEKYTREFAPEVIDRLSKDGHEIHIITARNPDYNNSRAWTLEWLKDSNIKYDYLEFTENKLEYCKNNRINLMIEDDVKQIEKISKLIPVICFDNRYNQGIEGINITRCYSWYDIYSKIEKIVK